MSLVRKSLLFCTYIPSPTDLSLLRVLLTLASRLLDPAHCPFHDGSRPSNVYDVGRRAIEPVEPVLWYMPVTACIDTDRLHRLQQIDTAYSTYEPVPVMWILMNDK